MSLAYAGPNAEQIRFWDETFGARWVEHEAVLDAQIAPLGLATIERSGVAPGERVIDVGCGCGQTTLELARRVGPAGAVLGIDVSTPMLARAKERTVGLPTVRLVQADAQTHRFEESFHVAYSRFGVMFFADPVAAFANLRRALVPGGRLAFVCWQALERNPWLGLPVRAIVGIVPLPPLPAPGAPGPFSFADPERVRGILAAAGFEDVALEPHEGEMPIGAGGPLEQAVAFSLRVGPVSAALREAQADAALEARAAEAIRAALAPYETDRGVRAAYAAWIASARVPA